jgi:Peptidyl-prolyl cis-trans isomerase (rotamase) - cyclophilin family
MKILSKIFFLLIINTLLFTNLNARQIDMENTLFLKLKDGQVEIELYPEVAPNHVKRIKELTRKGFYDGLTFHRVIDGFMAQTGDPEGNGTGGSGQNLKQEFNNIPHTKGVLSMARSMDPNSADSQFFIMFDDSPHLDGQYTVWGKVVKGIEYIDLIKRGDSAANGQVDNPDKIISLKVAVDVK